ncbi:hypothetical protein FACS1894204_11840 [Synergistales bacterium]|nr:hypothetical protein FACS1894204_11840 [Synergistales bacterium]
MYEKGDKVIMKNNPERKGFIQRIDVRPIGDVVYTVAWFDDRMASVEADDIELAKNLLSSEESLFDGRIADYSSFLRMITFQRISRNRPLSNQLLAFNASRTRFYPYQFKPLVKFLDSENRRVLICDEVGLGKTIEAGLILTECLARGKMDYILIVCPSVLRDKWQQEMKNRFAFNFEILKVG